MHAFEKMERRKSYYLAPTTEYPSSRPIALGSVVSSPTSAESPIDAPLPIDNTAMPIQEYIERDWELLLEKHKSGSIGLWASFLQFFGAGGDIAYGYSASEANEFRFDSLETRSFWPTKEYVQASVMAEPIQEYLRKRSFRHNVYMVVSIKIAFGANITRTVLQDQGVHVQAGVDASAVGLPVGGGPRGTIGWGRTESSSFKRDSGFVFAFRLREICYTTRRGISDRAYTKGALFGLDPKSGSQECAPTYGWRQNLTGNDNVEFELLGLADEDVRAEEVDHDGQDVIEDGEQCECVLPRR